ncbi:MAG: hypothetical protein H6662_16985 [Ardenticatenaceae bacterium]|nr:hypothetical protein [Anaerolineales bacterium]MCB8923285.1 hypothetical protein [Ardenticatenaceae bacterium]MCB8992026.1 hypothetical protein [Ardenticatenaceae bacterium]MCB9004715.1 hypothetical protein [Ardenticatenaceae bacterium]
MNQKMRTFSLIVLGLSVFGLMSFWGWDHLAQAQREENLANLASADASLRVRYRFSGVSDDGEQGSTNRKEATSIHCTNLSATDNQVEVQIIQWNGTDVFTGTLTMPPNATSTFSTQNTTIYYDDIFIGGSTPAIFQGSGRILSQSDQLICTAQVLDPLNYPPVFATKLTMFYADGTLVGDDRELFLPVVLRP